MAIRFLLFINGLEIVADEDAFEALVWQVARGETGKDAVAAFIRSHCVPR